MSRVAHIFRLIKSPLDATCEFGSFKGWTWRDISERDPEYIIWLVTESKVLLNSELEKALLQRIRMYVFQNGA